VALVSSSERTSSGTLHQHEFDLVDRVGLWGAPPVLTVEASTWAIPPDVVINPVQGRPGVEIYNMASWVARQIPVLDPPAWRTVALYGYVSGVPVDSVAGPVYPSTADGQPVFLLTRAVPNAPYSRAWCSFEPYLLTFDSHLRLADFVLLRHFGLGLAN
jgi:hypothetical protein